MQPGYFGDAGGPIMGACHTGNSVQSAELSKPGVVARPPVEVAVGRLFDRLGTLEAEVDMLIARLGPVSRSEKCGSGEATDRAECDCPLSEVLGQGAERADFLIARLSNARARLCI